MEFAEALFLRSPTGPLNFFRRDLRFSPLAEVLDYGEKRIVLERTILYGFAGDFNYGFASNLNTVSRVVHVTPSLAKVSPTAQPGSASPGLTETTGYTDASSAIGLPSPKIGIGRP